MHEDLYDHPLIKPLMHTDATVPVEAIERLASDIRRSKSLARKCNTLLRFETSFNLGTRSYLAVWLAFALALSEDRQALETFTDLFELVDPLEHDMLWELAQYALWQYGDRAVRAVLDDFWHILEMDHTGYYLGVLEVIGLSSDQLLQRRVADKVIHALEAPRTPPSALMGLVDIALILKDERLPGILESWKTRLSNKERKALEEVEKILFCDDACLRNDEFRLSWSELAEFSAEHFSIHHEAGLQVPTRGESFENLAEEFRLLAESFRRSQRFQEIPEKWREDPEEVIGLLTSIFVLLFETFGTLPDEADGEEVAALIRDVLPRKMVGEVSRFEPIPQVLAAFYRYLMDDYSREEGETFTACIRSAEAEMLEHAADPEYWDGSKVLAMKQLRSG